MPDRRESVTDARESTPASRWKPPPGSTPNLVVAVGCAIAGVIALFWRPSVAMLLWAVTVMQGAYVWGINRHWQGRRGRFDQQQREDLDRLHRSMAAGELGPAEGRERRAEIDARISPDDEYTLARTGRPNFGATPVLVLGWLAAFSGFGMIVAGNSFGPWVLVFGICISVSSLFIRKRDRRYLRDQPDRARSTRGR